MQAVKNKKVWFFFFFGFMILTTVCLYQAGSSEKEAFVQAILTELHAIGQEPEVTQYSFCTNGSHYAGEAGIKTIGLGPSREDLAHTDDEYIELEQLIKACEGYYAVMKALLR